MVPVKVLGRRNEQVTGSYTKKFTECESRCFIASVRTGNETNTEGVQTPLVEERGRCGQYILLKTSYVTRSVRPLHSWVLFLDGEFRLREELEVGFTTASRRLDSCKYKSGKHQCLSRLSDGAILTVSIVRNNGKSLSRSSLNFLGRSSRSPSVSSGLNITFFLLVFQRCMRSRT